MLLGLLIFISSCSFGSFSELYDVTTIYRIDEPPGGIEDDATAMSVEIHARTNALGLPFLVAGNVVEPEVGVEVPRCVSLRLSDVRCDWMLDNWDWTVWPDTPLLDTGDWSELQVTSLASPFLRFDEALFMRFSGLVHNQSYVNIVLTPTGSFLQNQKHFYYLQLSRLHHSFFHRCDNRIFERFTRFRDLDESIISIHCDRLVNVTDQMERWTYGKVNAENFLLVEIYQNGTVRLWNTEVRGDGAAGAAMMEWVDPEPIPVNYFTIRTDEAGNTQVKITNYGKRQVLTMAKNANIASITSPPIELSSNKICVSVVYHSVQSTTPTVLTVTAANQTVHLGQLDNEKDGWRVERFKAMLPTEMAEAEVRVHIKSVKNLGELHIQRIAGCNMDDEDIATISVLGGYSAPSDRIAYNVAVGPSNGAESQFVSVGDCTNGGLQHGNGHCVCPAGFTGTYCEIGCGPNRYGHDCGGLCSLRQQACRGLTLCTAGLGCFCAPGYKGFHCNETCEGRQYGNGCSQRCSNCAGRCDIYTGRCNTVCRPGYYPPYCKTLYKYTEFAPKVELLNYGEAVITLDLFNVLGQGNPTFFQIQYKLAPSFMWQTYISHPISSKRLSVVLQGLEHGRLYNVRAVLIDADLNSYQGSRVPQTQFLTKCFIPDEYDYQLNLNTTDTTITVTWQYAPAEPYSCPVVNYELSWQEGWRWLTHNVTNPTATLVDKLPVTEYRLRVRAVTTSDYAPYSETVSVRTSKQVPGAVSNITLLGKTGTSLTLSWNPPSDKDRYQLSYVISYECRKFAACEKPCSGGGEAHVTQPSVTLQGLLSLSQYSVSVVAKDGEQGPNVSAVYATQQSEPTEVVEVSSTEPNVTDHSGTVYWKAVDVCSGFFQEYAYQLFQEDDLTTILTSGTTKETSATFEELEGKTTYRVKVFVITSGGWNLDKYLLVNFTTKSSVPTAVEQLAVYKSSRSMLGLRWAPPARSYGPLSQFLVSLSPGSPREVTPTHCVVWPLWYCYTITDVQPDHTYTITVRAQNTEVPEYGPPGAEVEGTTIEKGPEKPSNLQIVNVSSTSFVVSWGFPLRANGLIRSFLVTVAETESVDYDHCCKPFPNIEIPVTAELPTYQTEVLGVNPASTYAVSVTGKTTVLGASESLTVHSRPPPLVVEAVPPVVVSAGDVAVEWLPQQPPDSSQSQLYTSLVRGYMLVALTDEEIPFDQSGIMSSQLNTLLRSAFNSSFFALTDYRGNETVTLDLTGSYDGFWGSNTWELKEQQLYRLVAVQVSKYFKAFGADVVFSKSFRLGGNSVENVSSK